MSTSPDRPLPEVDEDDAAFWASCRRHELCLQRCTACSAWRYPPSPVCATCDSLDSTWEPIAGAGIVYTRSVVHVPPSASFAAETPYVYAVVELDEGPMMPTNVVGMPVDEVEIGMPVRIVYDDVTADVTLPKFTARSPA